jgi:adenine-specific DNA-methyltransferase
MIEAENHTNNRISIEEPFQIPHIIKYMGSKRDLIKEILETINEIHDGEPICDLFGGTNILSGALGKFVSVYANDIQEYSSVLAKTYLGNYEWNNYKNIVEDVVLQAQNHVNSIQNRYPNLQFDYNQNFSLNEFNAIEQQQQELIYNEFNDVEHHLFIKNYSGTYWSFEQCLWIDALRISANSYSQSPVYYPILASLMHAMAYNAQSTGHYAQYRDANNLASMNDILIYRRKEILPYFKKKFEELIQFTGKNNIKHEVTTLDYRDCIDQIPSKTLVYADPPYVFVHYSRFYHALETLVKYDYPKVEYKGRYRNDRHQSPFCKKTEVVGAFREMFEKIKAKSSKLILSYSNSGMISLERILELAQNIFGDNYDINVKAIDYIHSTMGRSEDKSRTVKEYLIVVKPV